MNLFNGRLNKAITPGNEKSNKRITASYDAGDAEIYGLPHPIFTPAQLEKLTQANALDELLGVTRGNKELNGYITGNYRK